MPNTQPPKPDLAVVEAAIEAAYGVHGQANEVHKLIAKAKADQDQCKADYERLVRGGTPHEKHTVSQAMALQTKLSMFPFYEQNLEDQLGPIRATYAGQVRSLADLGMMLWQATLTEYATHLEDFLGPLFGGPYSKIVFAAGFGPENDMANQSRENAINAALNGSEFGVRINVLLKEKPESGACDDPKFIGSIQWASRCVRLFKDWRTFIQARSENAA